jgi:uncharacterized membrane protein
MKQVETSNKLKQANYNVLAIICIIFGGFAVILYMYQLYGFIFFENRKIDQNLNFIQRSNMTERSRMVRRPLEFLFSPFSITLLILGFLSIFSGVSILSILRVKDIDKTKNDVVNMFLTPEEKTVIQVIQKNGGSLTQNEISKITGFSRVKVHRIVKGLEMKNIIEKREFGMTNKLWLKED